MSVELDWLIDGHVLLVNFSGVVNDQTIGEMIERRRALAPCFVNNPVHTIVDLRHMETFDIGIGQLNELIGNLPHFCNSGHIVGIMDTSHKLFLAVQFVTRITMHQVGLRFQMCTNLEQGINYLRTVDRAFHGEVATAS